MNRRGFLLRTVAAILAPLAPALARRVPLGATVIARKTRWYFVNNTVWLDRTY